MNLVWFGVNVLNLISDQMVTLLGNHILNQQFVPLYPAGVMNISQWFRTHVHLYVTSQVR